LIPSVYKKFKT